MSTFFTVINPLAALLLSFSVIDVPAQTSDTQHSPTFYRDVLPLLQDHCQACHRAGEICADGLKITKRRGVMLPPSEMPGRSTHAAVVRRTGVGKFSDDPSLTDGQIATFAAWANASAPAGNPRDAPPPRELVRMLDDSRSLTWK